MKILEIIVDEKLMDLKQMIYGLLKIKGSHVYTIAEEEVFRSAIAYMADRLYDLEVAVAKTKQAMIDSVAAGQKTARARAVLESRK